MLPFRNHRAKLSSADGLEVSDDDILEVSSKPTRTAEIEIPIEVELEPQPAQVVRHRLPRPSPPPRTSSRDVALAAAKAPPPTISDPAVSERDVVSGSLAPVAMATEDAGSETVRIPRNVSPPPRAWWASRPTLAWAAAWVAFGAIVSMSAAYLMGFTSPAAPPPPAAAIQEPPRPKSTSDEVVIPSAKRQEVNVLSFGEDQATVITVTHPPAPSAAASAAVATIAPPPPAAHKPKPVDPKITALIGPTLTAAPEPKPAPPAPEPKPKRASPAPQGAVDALMEAQLKAATR